MPRKVRPPRAGNPPGRHGGRLQSGRIGGERLGPPFGPAAVAGGCMLVQFVIVEPESKKGRHTVRLPLLVGRSREAKFRIQQERVSRKHCEFTVDDGVVWVRDLGSTNGTQLEGQAIPTDSPTRVPPGGLIRVGSLGFRVEYDGLAGRSTVELRIPAVGDAETIEPFIRAAADVDIRFESDDPQPPPAAPWPASAEPPPPTSAEVEEEDDDLRRFLDGLG